MQLFSHLTSFHKEYKKNFIELHKLTFIAGKIN